MEPTDALTLCSDEELLGQFQNGLQRAFEVLVRRYERELFGYLRRYLGDATLADDVFQNTFLQLYTKINTYECGRPVRPWLFTIATHQAIDALRRNGRHAALSLDEQRSSAEDGDLHQLLDALQQRTPNPLDAVQGEERRQLVRTSVDQLPENLRQVVLLAYYHGLKYREIATLVGIPVGTVKSRLHTALIKLQEVWASSTAFLDEPLER